MSAQRTLVWKLLGLAAGIGVGLWLWRRGEVEEVVVGDWAHPADAAERIQRAFDGDPELGSRLRVDAISDGVVEILGSVAGRDQRDRAVAMAHNTAGVHTVVNRIVLEPEEARLEENRARNQEGSPSRQHYGMGVGMGTRRQSPDTDPDRPSDRQKLVERELDVDHVVRDDASGPEPAGRRDDGEGEPAP